MALAIYLYSGAGVLLWKRGESEVWLDNGHLWEELLSLFTLDGGVDNDIVTCVVLASFPQNLSRSPRLTWNPVDRGGDLVLVAGLQGIDNTEDLSGVAAGGSWV